LSDPNEPLAAIKRASERAAVLDAYRKAAEVLAGVRVTADSFAGSAPQVIARLQAFVSQPKICKTKFYADGGVDIVVMIPLTGELLKALLPEAGTKVAAGKSKFSGVVIDVSHLPFAPALAPTLLSPKGGVVFGQQHVKREVVASQGVVKYISSKTDAAIKTAGDNPLTIKAVELGSRSPSEIIVDEKAASMLADGPAFLGEGKVVIITTPVSKVECKELAAKVKETSVNWEAGLVIARGRGKVDFTKKEDNDVRMRMMERAAEVDAQARLAAAFQRIKVQGGVDLKEIAGMQGEVEAVVKNAVRCDAKYFADGSAEVVIAAPFARAAAKSELGKKEAPLTSEKLETTSIIIDASGLKYKPALNPRIYAPDGSMVFSAEVVAKEYVDQYGAAGYHADLKAAQKDQRAGAAPLVIKAEKTGLLVDQLIVAQADAEKIKNLKDKQGLFSRGRVIIVTQNAAD
jgi:hypothetical protein